MMCWKTTLPYVNVVFEDAKGGADEAGVPVMKMGFGASRRDGEDDVGSDDDGGEEYGLHGAEVAAEVLVSGGDEGQVVGDERADDGRRENHERERVAVPDAVLGEDDVAVADEFEEDPEAKGEAD